MVVADSYFLHYIFFVFIRLVCYRCFGFVCLFVCYFVFLLRLFFSFALSLSFKKDFFSFSLRPFFRNRTDVNGLGVIAVGTERGKLKLIDLSAEETIWEVRTKGKSLWPETQFREIQNERERKREKRDKGKEKNSNKMLKKII